MPVLTLADTLAIAASERTHLIEADDAVRDIASAIEDAAVRNGLDRPLVSSGLVGVMIAAAARQALAAYPSTPRDELAKAFGALAAEAFEWAVRRAAGSGRSEPS